MAYPYNVYGGLQDNAPGTDRRASREASPTAQWQVADRRRWLLGLRRPHRPRRRLQRIPGRQPVPEPQVHRRAEGHQAVAARGRAEVPLQLEHADPREPERAGHALLRRAVPVPLARPRARAGSGSRPTSPRTIPAKLKQDESGGLTLDNSTAENHCTIYAIAESPRSEDVIWVGTDDGNLQVTRDGGKTWGNVAPNVAGLPKNTWVSSIAAEPIRGGHGLRHLRRPHDRRHEAVRVRDDRLRQDLAGAGDRRDQRLRARRPRGPGEPGPALPGHRIRAVRVSSTAAGSGDSSRPDFPNVAVRDLAIHPREHDLMVATHGRGIYIIDDLTPLRALTSQVLESDAAFLPARAQAHPHQPAPTSTSTATPSSSVATCGEPRSSPTT